MAELYVVQGFERLAQSHPSAPLTRTEFQPFTPYPISISHAIIVSSALLNLENLIRTGFLAPAVESGNFLYSLLEDLDESPTLFSGGKVESGNFLYSLLEVPTS